MKQLSFKQYRGIDVFFLCVLTAVFEALATYATVDWFNLQAMAISITPAMICISLMRWGGYAIFPALAGAFAYCYAQGASIKHFVIYCGGCCLCLLSLPLLKLLTKDAVRVDFAKRTVFAIFTYLFVTVGRWIFSLFFEFSFKSILAFIFTDILSLLFAIVILFIAKNVDGLFEDQKSYLFRLERERLEEQKAKSNDPF